MLQSNYIEDYLPILEFQDSCIILEDGAVAIGYQLRLFSDEGVGEDTYKNSIATLSQTIRRFPVGTVIQQLDSYSNNLFSIEGKASFFHQKQIEHCNGVSFLDHVTYLFVICRSTPDMIAPHTTTFSCGRRYFKHPLAALKKTIDQVKKCSRELESAFPDGWDYKPLTASDNLNLLYAWLNLDFSGTINGLEHGMRHRKGFFTIGNKQVAIVSMQIKEMGASHVWLLHTSLWEHALLTSRPDERNHITRLIQEKGDATLSIAQWVDGQRKLQAK